MHYLVPIDFSDNSLKALDFALALASSKVIDHKKIKKSISSHLNDKIICSVGIKKIQISS